MLTRLDHQRGAFLFVALYLSILAVPTLEVLSRMIGLPVITLGAQILLLLSFLVLAPLKKSLTAVEALGLVLSLGVIFLYFIRDVIETGGLNMDALGNTLRCLTFAKLVFALRVFEMTQDQLSRLAKWTLLACLVAALGIRVLGISGSIRIEPILFSYGFGLFMMRTRDGRRQGLMIAILSLIGLALAQKASLLLAAYVTTMVMFPIVAVVSFIAALVLIPTFTVVLNMLDGAENLGRFSTRIRMLSNLTEGFDRRYLASLSSNRSEEYFFLIDQWRQNGFPIFGSGLSATLYLENVDIERSTFHSLFVNLVRLFGAVAILFFVLILRVIFISARISRMVFAIVIGLLVHNLLTYSFFHSPVVYMLLIFAPVTVATRVSDQTRSAGLTKLKPT